MLSYLLVAAFYFDLHAASFILGCQLRQVSIPVVKGGCRNKVIDANICYGGCESVSKPKQFVIPNNNLSNTSTDICNICVPSSFQTIKVPLNCQGRKRSIIFKTVKRFTSCICAGIRCEE